jgi:hypothetical protein
MPEVKTNYLPYIIGIIVIIIIIVVVILITQNNLSSTITFIPSTTAQIIKSKSLSTKKIKPKSQQQLEQGSRQQLDQETTTTPQNISMTTPQNISMTTPQNISITTPQNISITTPQNISTTTPQNISTTTPQNISTTKKIITKKPFYFATSAPLINNPVQIDNSDSKLCPSNPPPPCPVGTQACVNKHGYCYLPERNEMVSTYLGSELDRCPGDSDTTKTNVSFKIGDVSVWTRKNGFDSTSCTTAAQQLAQQAAQQAQQVARQAQQAQQALTEQIKARQPALLINPFGGKPFWL